MTKKRAQVTVRPVTPQDYDAWRPLWDEYNAFYERTGPTALPEEVHETTWRRFFDASEPVHCIVAERDGKVVGIVPLPLSPQHLAPRAHVLPAGPVHRA